MLPLPLTRCQCSVAPLEVAPLEVAHMVVVPEVLVQAQGAGVDTVVVAVAAVDSVAALRISDSRRRGSTTYALRIGSGAAVGGSPEAVT